MLNVDTTTGEAYCPCCGDCITDYGNIKIDSCGCGYNRTTITQEPLALPESRVVDAPKPNRHERRRNAKLTKQSRKRKQ